MTPKQLGFTMPAEWHFHHQCWMAWPCHKPSWADIGLTRARLAFSQIANAIACYEPVMMIVHPDDYANAKTLCNNDITLITQPIDDSWLRDTGPTFLLNDEGKLAGVDWLHNAWGGNYSHYELDKAIAKCIIETVGADYFQAPLVMEGGSFHVDGEGTVLTSRECLLNPNRNPSLSKKTIEQYLCDYLGTKTVIWLNQGLIGDETDGHIDEIACFIAPGKVLCLTSDDPTDANFAILQDNVTSLTNALDATGRRLDVITINQPPATYLNGKRLTLSYINFYLANQGIVMPAFGYPDYDNAAYQLLSQLYPNHHVTQLNALDIVAGGGGIHCITQQQPYCHLNR